MRWLEVSVTTSAENAEAATTISRWCSRAACALELIENARGVKGPVENAQQNKPWTPGSSVVTVALVVLGGAALVAVLGRSGK